MLLGIALASIFLIDPLYGGALTGSGAAKAVVIVFVFGPMLFHFLGRMLAAPQQWARSWRDMLHAWWPISLLALFITAGSLVARYDRNIIETFLNFGLGMLLLPLMALAVDSSAHRLAFFKGLAAIYVATSLLMYVVAGAKLHTLHEQIFIAVPLGLYFLTARKATPWTTLLGLALVIGTVVAFKNTTFILVATALAAWAVILALRVAQRGDRLRSFTIIYFGLLLALAVVCAAGLAWWWRREHLPSGNTGYRIEMYGIAIRRFLNSPLWGTAFADPSVTYFQLYEVAVGTNYLPTHSDVLDILGHGGLIAIGLWLATVWRILAITASAFAAMVARQAPSNERAWRWLFVLGMVQVGALITYAFNPPLIRLVNGLWIWGGAGVLWALHRYLTLDQPSHVPATAPRRRGAAGNRYSASRSPAAAP